DASGAELAFASGEEVVIPPVPAGVADGITGSGADASALAALAGTDAPGFVAAIAWLRAGVIFSVSGVCGCRGDVDGPEGLGAAALVAGAAFSRPVGPAPLLFEIAGTGFRDGGPCGGGAIATVTDCGNTADRLVSFVVELGEGGGFIGAALPAAMLTGGTVPAPGEPALGNTVPCCKLP